MPTYASSATPRSRAIAALVIGLAALVVFMITTHAVTAASVGPFDLHVEQWCAAHQSRALHAFFGVVSILAGITGMRIIGFTSAALLFLFRSRRLGIGMLAIVLAGMQTFEIAKRFVARQRPAHGYAVDPTYAFPSGHATLAAAVCCTLAYVLWREGILPDAVAFAAGIVVPVVVGISRVYLDMHWATDVVGGWLAGLIIACVAAAAYELTPTTTTRQ